ncbi:PQQ-dependent sugar dehydrogenase [Halocatena salina]|uniref:PQQ-dependent sugar dehydrogenase n=1 Tax=Halocatena salina TaxID=2934340 RepID=A0A8U0A0R0_9EURY|nr:PQQ-dependent sugar dehydrogenase [Halocatena salina]UPM42379.1 PQQ-dependent sugar dehydrogenase [Halocatena salina]
MDEIGDNQYERMSLPVETRRAFLKAVGATGALIGGGGIAVAQDTPSFEFGGVTPGWEGRTPSSIDGETNPTLELSVGQTYTIVWENVDGLPHDFVILDANEEEIVGTEIVDEQGATLTLEFEATEEMAEYYCSVHPASMRGAIQIGDGDPDDGDEPFIPEGPSVELETVAEGLVSPTNFVVAEEQRDRRFITDQTGQIYVHGPDGVENEPFMDISDRLVNVGVNGYDERGLLGLAFHPEFESNRRFYVRYSAPLRDGAPENYDHTFVLSEFRATTDLRRADSETERVLLEIPQPQFNHNAGDIAFGPDGYLYVPVGDGGDGDDTGLGHVDDWYAGNDGGNGQDVTENLLGSILRLDVDDTQCGKPYSIPDDNPLVGREGFDEQYAWGFRNPWRLSFTDGELFVADVGQERFEEINIVESGGNYGWNVKEGSRCFSTDSPETPPENCPTETSSDVRGGESLIDPVIEYPHRHDGESIGISVIGGYVYSNDTIPELTDTYVFGDANGGLFAASRPADDTEQWSMERLVVESFDRYVLAFGRDHDGELYVLTNEQGTVDGETGTVQKIVPTE